MSDSEGNLEGLMFKHFDMLFENYDQRVQDALVEISMCFNILGTANVLGLSVPETSALMKNNDERVMEVSNNLQDYEVDFHAFKDAPDLVLSVCTCLDFATLIGCMVKAVYTGLILSGNLKIKSDLSNDLLNKLFENMNFDPKDN